jgi:hypothetical protein
MVTLYFMISSNTDLEFICFVICWLCRWDSFVYSQQYNFTNCLTSILKYFIDKKAQFSRLYKYEAVANFVA